MRHALRLPSLTLLVAALLLSAVATGHARGQAPATGEVVLCVGTQVVTVSVDENGQPVTVIRACPDAVLNLAAPLLPPVVVSQPGGTARTLPAPADDRSVTTVRPLEDRARAPPLSA
jgi:hypothetical protein